MLGAPLNEGWPRLPRQSFAGVTGSTGFTDQDGAGQTPGAAGTEIAPSGLVEANRFSVVDRYKPQQQSK
jgi:hypothetical protein